MQRVTVKGRRLSMGLGPWPVVSLKEARETALSNRQLARKGVDPRRAANGAPDFAAAMEKAIAIRSGAWKDAGKSRAQWEASLGA